MKHKRKTGGEYPPVLVVSLKLYANCAKFVLIDYGLHRKHLRPAAPAAWLTAQPRGFFHPTAMKSTAPTARTAPAPNKGTAKEPVRWASGAANSGPRICPTP